MGSEHTRKDLDHQHPDGPDGERAGPSRCGVARPPRRLVELIENAASAGQEFVSRVRQLDTALGAIQEPHAQIALELTDVPSQRRLREPKDLRGAMKVQLLRRRL